jgi:hypothetical protein
VSESESMHCRRLLKHTEIFIGGGAGAVLFPEKVQSKWHYQMDTLGRSCAPKLKAPGER